MWKDEFIALHTAVDRNNLLAHLCVVSELYITEMDEFAAYPGDGCDDDDENDDV